MSDLPTDATWATVQKLAAAHEEINDVRQAWQDCRKDVTTLRQELDEARDVARELVRYYGWPPPRLARRSQIDKLEEQHPWLKREEEMP